MYIFGSHSSFHCVASASSAWLFCSVCAADARCAERAVTGAGWYRGTMWPWPSLPGLIKDRDGMCWCSSPAQPWMDTLEPEGRRGKTQRGPGPDWFPANSTTQTDRDASKYIDCLSDWVKEFAWWDWERERERERREEERKGNEKRGFGVMLSEEEGRGMAGPAVGWY